MRLDQVKPVLQTEFSPAKGNALQACVARYFAASILELPLDAGTGAVELVCTSCTACSRARWTGWHRVRFYGMRVPSLWSNAFSSVPCKRAGIPERLLEARAHARLLQPSCTLVSISHVAS